MGRAESLSHTKCDCKYHGYSSRSVAEGPCTDNCEGSWGEVFRRLAEQKASRIEEGYLTLDHVHMMIAIPSKYSVAQVIGYIKGKSAVVYMARVYGGREGNFVGQHFWARGYFVSTGWT